MTSWQLAWSVGIYQGPGPLTLGPEPGLPQPVLAPRHVTDVRCRSVADPFLLHRDGSWHVFVEIFNLDTDRGEIAYATSPDGLRWAYQGVVLREPFHLSYPLVFEWDGGIYMLPESKQANAVRLYAADRFPDRWRPVATLLTGQYADPTIARIHDRWWMFAQRGLDELRLFSSDGLEGPWTEHPRSPIRAGNRRVTRPAGRIVATDGRLIRFAQDAWPSYGSRVRAIEIDRLTPGDYAEHECPESPVLQATHAGWNAMGMHHVDAQPIGAAHWIAAVDGATLPL